jgi:hypothetical protein
VRPSTAALKPGRCSLPRFRRNLQCARRSSRAPQIPAGVGERERPRPDRARSRAVTVAHRPAGDQTTVSCQQSPTPPAPQSRLGTGARPVPNTRATVAICGYGVRRAGCLNLALRLAFGLRIRPFLILHTREIGWPRAGWRRSPGEVQPPRPAGAGDQPPEGQARAVRRRLDDCFRRASRPRFPTRRICRGLIRSFRRFARQPM